MNIKTVPLSYTLKWLTASWKVAKHNYRNVWKFMFISAALALAIAAPLHFSLSSDTATWLRGAATSALLTFLSAGFTLAGQKWAKKENPPTELLFIGFTDKVLFKRILPLAVLSAFVSAFMGVLQNMGATNPNNTNYFALGILGLLGLVFNVGTAFSIPQMAISGISFSQSIGNSIHAVFKNLHVLIAMIALYAVIAMIALIPLGIPFLFVMVPAYFVMPYLKYATIFLNLDLENFEKSYVTNPVETVTRSPASPGH